MTIIDENDPQIPSSTCSTTSLTAEQPLKMSNRIMFDSIFLNTISFLESHIGVTSVEIDETRDGVAAAMLSQWE